MELGLYERLKAGEPLVWTVPGVLSAEECAALIARIEALEPGEAPINVAGGFQRMEHVRNNDRVMFDDAELAQQVYRKVAHTIPAAWEGRAPCGANERLRCYRYQPGQYFKPHHDGCFRRSPREQSELTLMVYLNDDFEGGETAFEDLEEKVRPVRGSALLFFHPLRHEGCTVTRGTKYVLRIDVMYREV